MKKFSILITLMLAFTFVLGACADADENENAGSVDGTPVVETTAEVTMEPMETEVAVEPLATPTALAGDVEPEETEVVTGTTSTELEDFNLVSNLIGYEIEKQNGDDVGTIDSLIVNRQGQLIYAVIDPDDGLEVDGDLVAVPWNSFTMARADQNLDDDAEHDLVFNLDDTALSGAPAFASDGDIDIADGTWDDELVAFWGSQVSGLPNTGVDDQNGVVRLKDVTDYQLLNSSGEDIGDVEDMVLDTTGKQISYVIWASGGFLDIGEDLIPVPFEKLSWEKDNNDAFVLNVSDAEQMKDAPRLQSLDDLDTSVADWDNEFRTWWNNFKSDTQ